jgi:hypothetical protein
VRQAVLSTHKMISARTLLYLKKASEESSELSLATCQEEKPQIKINKSLGLPKHKTKY